MSWKDTQHREPLWLKHRRIIVDQAKQLAQILRESDAVYERPTIATAAGDERRLRGIPAIGRGVAGAINGTKPGAALE